MKKIHHGDCNNNNKVRTVILVPDEVNVKAKSSSRDREVSFAIMSKHQENTTSLNLYGLNNTASNIQRKTWYNKRNRYVYNNRYHIYS